MRFKTIVAKCLLVVELYLPCPVITKLGSITTVVALVVELCFVGLKSSKPLCFKSIVADLFATCGAVFDGSVQCRPSAL